MKRINSIITVLVTLLSFSCKNIGLGESVDLEAPVCKITSHTNMSYVKRSFTLAGTCTDNKEVTKVEIFYTSSGTKIGDAKINGDRWYYDFVFDKDQEVDITVTASDAGENTSEDSFVQITLVIDEENPVLKSVNLLRCGLYPVNFATKEKLEDFVSKSDNTENKDYFQNEKVVIQGNLSDNYKLSNATVSIYDQNDNLVLKDVENSSSTAYTPEFILTQEMFSKANKSFTTGVHYFYSVVHLEDEAHNIYEEKTNYFCWWPESDLAKVEYVLATKNEIKTIKNNSLPVNFFDDDGIKNVYYKIIKKSEWNQKLISNSLEEIFNSYKISDFSKKECNGVRDEAITVNAGSDSGNYVLFVIVEDSKSDGSKSAFSYTYCSLFLSSEDYPIMLVESPEENTTPDAENLKFTISGKILDIAGGCKASVAWVPNINNVVSDESIAQAQLLLQTFTQGTENTKTDSSGIKMIKLSLEDKDSEKIDSITYKKQTYSQEFNIQEFFQYKGAIQNQVKCFIFYVIDSNENEIYKTFRLGAYIGVPKITVKYNNTGIDDNYSLTLDDIKSFSKGDKLYISVSAIGANGIPLDETYDIQGNWTSEAQTNSNPISWVNKINHTTQIGPTEGLKEAERYSITLSAKDIFGNTCNTIKTITTGSIGSLNKLVCNQNKGSILTEGTTLILQAEFNEAVEIYGEGPKIKLTNIYIDNTKREDQYATYYSGTGTSTILFKYTVPSNAYSDGYVTCESELADTSKINSINNSIDESYNEVESKQISIDGVSPSLELENCTPKNLEKAEIAGKDFVTLRFSENVIKENGTITIRRRKDWAIPIVMTESEFKKYYNKMSDANKIVMIGSSTGEAKLSETTGQPVGPYVKNVQGLDLSNTNVESDRNTKYVLRFDLDPHSTTGEVSKLRQALESVDYHQVKYDVTDKKVTINGSNVEISGIESSFFVNGREYEILITEGCFRDKAGNTSKEVKEGVYTFWDKKVATPVIRVDKYTHGWGAKEPDKDGNLVVIGPNSTEEDSDSSQFTRPTGYARVRIDSETPETQITYGSTQEKIVLSDEKLELKDNNKTQGTLLEPKITTSNDVKGIDAKTEYLNSKFTLVGDESLYTGSRTYLKALATASGFEPSEAGYEGAYKTIVFYKNPAVNGADKLKIQGTSQETDKTGVSILAGFPLRNADPDDRFSKYCYKIPKAAGDNTTNEQWVLVSYDFVYKWYIQSVIKNWEKDNHSAEPSYGCVYYTFAKDYY